MDKEKTFDEIYEEDCRVVDKLFEKAIKHPDCRWPAKFDKFNSLPNDYLKTEIQGFVEMHRTKHINPFAPVPKKYLPDYLQNLWRNHRMSVIDREYQRIKDEINNGDIKKNIPWHGNL